MDRRNFLQGIAATAAGFELLSGKGIASTEVNPQPQAKSAPRTTTSANISVDGFTQVAEFKTPSVSWKVYEDLRTRDGALAFVSSSGTKRLLPKSAEAAMPEGTPY